MVIGIYEIGSRDGHPYLYNTMKEAGRSISQETYDELMSLPHNSMLDHMEMLDGGIY